MTREEKAKIDGMSYEEVLELWRFSPSGSPLFQGETGTYFAARMKELREAGADHVGASKRVGWEGRNTDYVDPE